MTNDNSNAANIGAVAAASNAKAKTAAMTAHQDNLHAPDFVNELFERTASEQAPLIKFNELSWSLKTPEQKINYLHKLASSMNHAALKIQDERDELLKLLFHKEALIEKLQQQLGSDRMLIHKQLERENAERQKLLDENQGLYAQIKELDAKLKEFEEVDLKEIRVE